jgi:hypothetical protein
MGIMAKATWEGAVLAESDATVEVEGNQYFPPDAIRKEYFKPSDGHTGVSVEGHGELLRCRSEGQTERGSGVVLSGAEGGGEADYGVCGVLEGRDGGDVVALH